jgi:hypothetical protein
MANRKHADEFMPEAVRQAGREGIPYRSPPFLWLLWRSPMVGADSARRRRLRNSVLSVAQVVDQSPFA